MDSCLFLDQCSSNYHVQYPIETTEGFYSVLKYLSNLSSNQVKYNILLNQIFVVWTINNIIKNTNYLIQFFPLIGEVLDIFLPGLSILFESYSQSFIAYLNMLYQLPLSYQNISVNMYYKNLNELWIILLEEIENTVTYIRDNNIILDYNLISLFPIYSPYESNNCHSNYNNLLGNNTTIFRPKTLFELKNFLKTNNKQIKFVSDTSLSFNDDIFSKNLIITSKYLAKFFN